MNVIRYPNPDPARYFGYCDQSALSPIKKERMLTAHRHKQRQRRGFTSSPYQVCVQWPVLLAFTRVTSPLSAPSDYALCAHDEALHISSLTHFPTTAANTRLLSPFPAGAAFIYHAAQPQPTCPRLFIHSFTLNHHYTSPSSSACISAQWLSEFGLFFLCNQYWL